MGGTSDCTGKLEVKQQNEWRPVDGDYSDWNLKVASVVCRQLHCGSAVRTERSSGSTDQPVWRITLNCVGSETSVMECKPMRSGTSSTSVEVFCSGEKQ